MTVAQLREALAEFPDYRPVEFVIDDGVVVNDDTGQEVRLETGDVPAYTAGVADLKDDGHAVTLSGAADAEAPGWVLPVDYEPLDRLVAWETAHALNAVVAALSAAETHRPCCSSHGRHMTCADYRRTHFVEVRPCCATDAAIRTVLNGDTR